MKIELLDGAMGTTISDIYQVKERCREKVNFTNPEIIRDIHKRYSEAGADYLKANTFNCSKESLKAYGENPEKAYEYAFLGGSICKEISKKYGKKSIGTFCDGDIDQIDGILDSDVDIVMIETIYNLEKGLKTLELLKKRMEIKKIDKPIMISFAVDRECKIYSGEQIIDIYKRFTSEGVISLGINCSEYSQQISKVLKEIKKETKLNTSFHPNLDGDIEKFAKNIKKIIDDNAVSIVGGCCGTEFNHIKKMREIIDKIM